MYLTDLALLVNVARHNTNFTFLGLDDTGTVGADQPGFALRFKDFCHLEFAIVNLLPGAIDLHDCSIRTRTMSC